MIAWLVFSVAIIIIGAWGLGGLFLPNFDLNDEVKHGTRKPTQEDDGSAEDHTSRAALITQAYASAARAAQAVSPGAVTWVSHNPVANTHHLHQMQLQAMLHQQALAQSQAYGNPGALGAGMGFLGSGPVPPNFFQAQAQLPPYMAASSVKSCDRCGMAHTADKPHACPEASETDLGVIKTIQLLASHGLSPEEIAGDMKLVIGYRHWNVGGDLAGAGTGSTAKWPLDKPTMAVCVSPTCAIDPAHKVACAASSAPRCRIHAWKTSELDKNSGYPGVAGAVALWGEVVECEKGYLATRAYPLGFESEGWARGYRVAFIRPPAKDPQP